MIQLSLRTAARTDVLAGSLLGQRMFASWVRETQSPVGPELCFIDFEGIAVATASFLRDSVLAYRDYVRKHHQNLYPVGANLNSEVSEELHEFLSSRTDAFVVCDLGPSGKPKKQRVIGRLEGKQLLALQEVLKRGETDAPTLAEAEQDQGAPTVWNNRLAALAARGLLIEINQGRGKRYKPVIEGLQYGS